MTTIKGRLCTLSGVPLDDGHPLHRGVQRIVRGRVEWVALTVAGALDHYDYWRDVEAFIATMLEREAYERRA